MDCAGRGVTPSPVTDFITEHTRGVAADWPVAPLHGSTGIMFMVKVSALFAAYFLLISQMYSSHAAPRSAGDSATDTVVLSDYEARRLINAIVKEFVQMTAEEVEQNDGNSSVSVQKRACNTATLQGFRPPPENRQNVRITAGPGGSLGQRCIPSTTTATNDNSNNKQAPPPSL
ncbi:hypothetical protein MHYP_G00117080 [Metynnis hypsauchen]